MTAYTLIAVLLSTGGSWRPVSISTPDLPYGECTQQIANLKNSNQVEVMYADCVPQVEKKD